MLGSRFGSPRTIGEAVCNRLNSGITAGTTVGSSVFRSIHTCPRRAGDGMILLLSLAVRTGSTRVSAGVLSRRDVLPCGCRDCMVPVFISAVPTGTGLCSAVLRIIVRSPGTVSQTVVCLFNGTVRTSGTGISSLMLGVRDTCPCSTGDTMRCFLRLAVTTRRALIGALMLGSGDAGPCTVGDRVRSGFRGAVTAYGAGLSAGVLGIRSTCPRTVSNRMIHILIGGVATGAGYLSTMLGIIVGSVATVGQRVACILVSAVITRGTGLGSAVLGSIVIRPASIGEAMTLLCGRTNIRCTGGAVRTNSMLRRTGIWVGSRCGVVGVGIGAFAAIRAGIRPAVLRGCIVFPSAVSIGAMSCTVVNQLTTVPTILVPVTP